MESKLSSFYNRIRRTFRRRMDEVPYKSHPPEPESRLGNQLHRTMITPILHIKDLKELKREQLRTRARELMEIMEEVEQRQKHTGYSPRPGKRMEINKFGMMRIVVSAVADLGMLPPIDYHRLEREGVLTPREIKNLKDIIPMVKLMLESTVK
ncbi:accessory protein [Ninapo virus]|nr:accessory protein [Ninapo virus]